MHKKVSNAKLCHFHLPQLVTVTDFYHSVSSMWCHFNFMYQGLHQKPLENEILQFWSRHSNLFLGIGCEKCLMNSTRSAVSVSFWNTHTHTRNRCSDILTPLRGSSHCVIARLQGPLARWMNVSERRCQGILRWCVRSDSSIDLKVRLVGAFYGSRTSQVCWERVSSHTQIPTTTSCHFSSWRFSLKANLNWWSSCRSATVQSILWQYFLATAVRELVDIGGKERIASGVQFDRLVTAITWLVVRLAGSISNRSFRLWCSPFKVPFNQLLKYT